MTLKDAHKRAARTLDSATIGDDEAHYYLLTGKLRDKELDMGAAMRASTEILAEMLITSMRESPEVAVAVLTAAHKYIENVNEQEVN